MSFTYSISDAGTLWINVPYEYSTDFWVELARLIVAYREGNIKSVKVFLDRFDTGFEDAKFMLTKVCKAAVIYSDTRYTQYEIVL